MGDRVRIVKGVAPPPDGPQMPNTYVPPRMDAARSGWNHYFPTTWSELKNLASGATTVTRPAVIYLDPAIAYTSGSGFGDTVNFDAQGDEDNGWLYVMPLEADYANIAPEGTRIDPAAQSASMPTLTVTAGNTKTLQIAINCRRIRLIGIEMTHDGTNNVDSSAVNIGRKVGVGDEYPSDVSEFPDEIVVDRCWIHGSTTWLTNHREGLFICASRTAVIESRIEWFRGGAEAKAIWIPWPCSRITIWNNYLEAVGMGFLTAGTNSPFEAQLEDIDCRYNEITKDQIWNENAPEYVGRSGGLHKNHWELKTGVRCYCAFNYMHDQWKIDDNQGRPLTVKSVSYQDLDPHQRLSDIIMEWNDCRHNPRGTLIQTAGNNFEVQGFDRVVFRDNLFVCSNNADDNFESPMCSNSGLGERQSWNPDYVATQLWYHRNTFIGALDNKDPYTANTMVSFSTPFSSEIQFEDFQYVDNVSDGARYGIFLNGGGFGDDALGTVCDPYTCEGNVVYNTNPSTQPAGVTIEDTIDDVGFAQTTDPFASWQISGTHSDKGCNYAQLMINTATARSGVRF